MCPDPERGGGRTGTPSLFERLDGSGLGLRLWLLVVSCSVHDFARRRRPLTSPMDRPVTVARAHDLLELGRLPAESTLDTALTRCVLLPLSLVEKLREKSWKEGVRLCVLAVSVAFADSRTCDSRLLSRPSRIAGDF
jgi:hypothetical protein